MRALPRRWWLSDRWTRALILVPLATLAVAATSSDLEYDYAKDVIVDGKTVIIGVWSVEGPNISKWDELTWHQCSVGMLTEDPDDWYPATDLRSVTLDELQANGESLQTTACVSSSPMSATAPFPVESRSR